MHVSVLAAVYRGCLLEYEAEQSTEWSDQLYHGTTAVAHNNINCSLP